MSADPALRSAASAVTVQRQGHVDSDQRGWHAPRYTVETEEFAAMMGRMLRAWKRRVALADTYDLAEMIEFGRSFDAAIKETIAAGRRAQPEAWSWAEIGEAAGISRQAAQQRWGTRDTLDSAAAQRQEACASC